ncbi:MAG: aminopeptidase P family protein [Balneolaceae bacterium]
MSLKSHRTRLLDLFETPGDDLVYLQGASVLHRHGTDYEYPFRQESNFLYLTGVDEPDFSMILDLESGEYHLFAPWRPPRYAVWNGHITPPEILQERYAPDHLHVGGSLAEWIHHRSPGAIYCLNEDQSRRLSQLLAKEGVPRLLIETSALSNALAWCRVIKDEQELEWCRTAARINNQAHLEVLRALRPGMHEFECKAVFEYHQVRHGLVQDAYNGIHASGPNSAVLHYTRTDRKMEAGDLYLIDAGHEANGYASDITRTWPVSGTYTPVQRMLYSIVLHAQNRAIEMVRPGIRMEELHLAAAKTITAGLVDAGWLNGRVEDLMENEIHTLFFPHGLGHFLGLDTHDVGGVRKGEVIPDRPGLKTLRVRRELEPGMILTVEPGLYLIPALLEPAFEDSEKSHWLNRKKIEPHLQTGGIRIEDNLVVTKEGAENLTTVPKDVDEIESFSREANSTGT